MGNTLYGVLISSAADLNTIGGPDPAGGNLIAGGGNYGIRAEVTAGHGDAFLSNRIGDSAYLGIDLGAAGVDANDAGDADDGANGLQNYPISAIFADGFETGDTSHWSKAVP